MRGGENHLTLTLPEKRYAATEVAPYRAEMWPGGRLAGLFATDDDESRRLAPLAFVEVPLPDGKDGQAPRLSSKVPGRNWVFQWDARRRVGYLLVPRARRTTRGRWSSASTGTPNRPADPCEPGPEISRGRPPVAD